MYSAETSEKVRVWRERAAAGTLTLDEMKEVITHLRAGRAAAATAPDGSKKKTTAQKKAPIDSDDLLKGLE